MATSKLWSDRIKSGNKAYNTWANKFRCNILEQYYEGDQWKFNTFFTEQPYKVNLVYSTIKVKAANLILSYPEYEIAPKPGNMDWNEEVAVLSAALKQDVLNQTVSNDKEAIAEVMELCFLDSMFRFGIMEIGYANDWLRNPLATIPLRKDQVTIINKADKDVSIDDKPKIDSKPKELPQNEQIYFKHVSAKRFRVGARDNVLKLNRADWFGYYDYVLRKDLQVIDGLKSDTLKEATPNTSSEARDYSAERSEDGEKPEDGDVIKIWHAWDPRAKKRYLIIDSTHEVIWEEAYKREPFTDLRWDLRLSTWYPIPPVWQWLSPQNEYNESREAMRNHRKRFVRKFGVSGDDMDQEEIDKFTSGEDGALIKLPRPDAIKAIENPSLNGVSEGLLPTLNDFNLVSGQSSADKGASDRTTATETQRIAMKADIRDSAEDAKMQRFMMRAGREALLLMQERFEAGMWISLTADAGEGILETAGIDPQTGQPAVKEAQANPAYQWVASEVIDDGYDFKINVNIVSAAPQKMQDEQGKFITFVTLLSKFPMIGTSPKLVRETAYRCGYRNERIIREFQQQAMLAAIGQTVQAQQAAGAEQAAQQVVGQKTPPQGEEIQNKVDRSLIQ